MKITSDHQIDVAKQIFSPNHIEQKIPPEIIVLHCSVKQLFRVEFFVQYD